MVEEASKSSDLTSAGNRLAKLGRASVPRKPDGGPPELTARHKLLISYMIDGCGHETICRRIMVERSVVVDGLPAKVTRHPKPGEPLGLIEAADLLGVRRRNARQLMSTPIFKAAFDQELRRFREGERAASMHTLVDIRDDLGGGRAADRKVRLTAAQMLLGEGTQGSSVTINNTVTAGVVRTAGIVIDLREDDEIEAEERLAASTIEHRDEE